ncbi:MAG TPA: hypothetical protein GX004_09140 [Firmicutes bacterium]|jgi:uncharacterized repeat protein (TIGR02543 family)|nr:hypothetical protein [Bacillota bacterium]
MSYQQRWYCKVLAIFLAFVMLGAAPFSIMQAYATEGGGEGASQTWPVSSAGELEAALASFRDGDTIKLTANITYSKGIELNDKSLTFDVGTYTLNVYNNEGSGLLVGAGAEVCLTGSGKFIVSGTPCGVKAEGLGAKAEVTGASGGGTGGIGAYASQGGQIIVKGDVSGPVGAEASGEGSQLTITGKVKGTYTHGVKASHGGKITVHGQVTSTFQDGVYADLGGEIEVQGDVEGQQNGAYVGGNDLVGKYGSIHITGKVTGQGGSGVLVEKGGTAVINGDVTGWTAGAYCLHGDITVNGNVRGTTAGVTAGIKNSTITVRGNVIGNAAGAVIANYGLVQFTGPVGGKIIIDGEIQSNKDYIRINNVVKDGTPESRDVESGLDGYYSYSEANPKPTERNGTVYATSVVFVKVASGGMVCEIDEVQYATLGEALEAVKDGETIKLLQNITHTDPIKISEKTINFELGNYNLMLDTSAENLYGTPVLTVKDGGKLILAGGGTGQFNVKGWSTAVISILGANSEATVHNVELIGNGDGVYMYGSSDLLDGGAITVKGDIKAEDGNGITVNAKNATVVVDGNITAGVIGVETWTNFGVLVTVNGNITVIDDTPDDIYVYEVRGIRANSGTTVKVNGNVTVEGRNSEESTCIGVHAYGGTIIVDGNVVSSASGAKSNSKGNIKITGSLSAGTPFVILGSTEMTADQGKETDEGFLVYTDGSNTVQIGSTGDLVINVPDAPQNFTATTGDTQVTLNWIAPASNGGSEITHYEVSSDNGVTWITAETDTSHTFTGLTNGTTYTFKVRAVNSKGPGAEASTAATPEAVSVLTHTVNFYSNGSLYASKTVTGSSALDTDWPDNPTRSGYSFGGWFSGQNGTGTPYTSATIITADVNLYAKWTYNSDGGDNTPAPPTYKADVKAENGTETALPVKVDKGAGTASIETEEQSLAQGKTAITMPSIPGVNTYSAGIPVPDLSTADVQGKLTLDTKAGSITVQSNMLTGVANTDGNKAQITIGRGDKSKLPKDVRKIIGDRPLIQLSLSIDGRQIDWFNPNAPVTISIPYAPTEVELANRESIVIWYIDGSGNAVTIPNGRYDPASGMVTFSTTHFSRYAVAYNKVNFNDVPASAWYAPAVSFIAAREIALGTEDGKYSPDVQLSRGEFIVLMMRAYGIAPDTNPADNFSDAGNTYYTGFLAAAKRLGIATGVGNNRFAPKKEITRQEMFTLLYNALKAIGQLPEDVSRKMLSDFSDAGQVGPWAKNAISMLIRAGVISGSNGKLSPLKTTTRAEIAQVLYNLLGE